MTIARMKLLLIGFITGPACSTLTADRACTALRPQLPLEHAVKSRLVIIPQKLGNVRQWPRSGVGPALKWRCSRGHMMWSVFQSSIIFAVVASNIKWHWTPNGYLPAILGAGLAWLLTRLLNVRECNDI